MAKLHDLFSNKGAASQRPLRVGEEIRHIMADIFIRSECRSPDLFDVHITISEVRVAPDMKNATAFFMPLAGQNKEKLLKALKDSAPEIRHLISKRIKLRHTPKIHFALDESYEVAEKINMLLKSPEVARDLQTTEDEGSSMKNNGPNDVDKRSHIERRQKNEKVEVERRKVPPKDRRKNADKRDKPED